MITERICNFIKHPEYFIMRILRRTCRFMSDKSFLKMEHRIMLKEKLDFDNPVTFNQKLQWMKLSNTNQVYTKLVDKFLVREYVKEKIGSKYLIPLIGVYNNEEEIDFCSLPNKFALKANHGSGWNIICSDKSKLDIKLSKKLLKSWLKQNYYWHDREIPYKNVQPRIICEEFIKTKDNKQPVDYKVFCFNGIPKFFFIASDRGEKTKFDFFDMEWNRIPVTQHYPNSSYDHKKPLVWDEMIGCVKMLAEGFPHVRVDFYIDSDDNIIFGEMTFGHFGGVTPFNPKSYDLLFGNYLELPQKS